MEITFRKNYKAKIFKKNVMNIGVTNELICVACKNRIQINPPAQTNTLKCQACSQEFPVIEDIPVMINENESIFSFSDFTNHKNLFFDISKKGSLISTISKIAPSIGGNNLGKKNFNLVTALLENNQTPRKPRVLILGGSIIGEGMSDFVHSKNLDIIEGDVSFGPRTKIIFDAHTIPYANESFDCVIVQAVLEHVISSKKCVEEIYRVLKKDGIVYAETPFMQQVHGGPYDFTRYTRSGHRKLFEKFEEIESGATAGSGTSLAWSYQYFLLALFGYTRTLRLVTKFFARLTGFWIKYLDYLTRINKYDSDGASGFYFLGRKSTSIINDKELISYYSKS